MYIKCSLNKCTVVPLFGCEANIMKSKLSDKVYPCEWDHVYITVGFTAVARTLIGGGGGGVYSYIHVLPDEFLLKSNSNLSIWKETSRAEHEYMNNPPPPPTPINVLATAVVGLLYMVGFVGTIGGYSKILIV